MELHQRILEMELYYFTDIFFALNVTRREIKARKNVGHFKKINQKQF